VPANARGLFDVDSSIRIADITDGTSNTFAMGEGAGNNQKYKLRATWSASTPFLNPTTNQPILADQSWACGMIPDPQVVSAGDLYGSVLGVTAQCGGWQPTIPILNEPMNNQLVMAAIDNNQGCDNNLLANYDTLPGFRSMHTGGANFLFCDGSVHFMSANIDLVSYTSLSTVSGGEILASNLF
jgi:prepilin-type processing-associated H-X9-DG protein